MAQIVKLRRSSVSGQKPTNSNLQLGELALNTTDGKVYMAKSGSLGPSVEELVTTNTVNTGSLSITGAITGSVFTGSFIGDGSGLYNLPIQNINTASLATTGSNIFVGNQTITGSINITGTVDGVDISDFSSSVNTRLNSVTASGGISAIYIADEGSIQGTASYFDFIGAGISAAVNNGTASITVTATGGGGSAVQGASQTYAQTTNAVTWSIDHSINSRTPVVEIYDQNYNVIIPTGIYNPGAFQTLVYFDVAQRGYAIISTGGGLTVDGANAILDQSSDSSTWTFNHNLGTKYPVFNIFDSNDDVIIPQRINVVDENSAVIYFSSARSGKAVASVGGDVVNSDSSSFSVSSSFATNANFLDGLDSLAFVQTGSFQSYTSSFSSSVAITTSGLTTTITSLSSSLTSSIGSLSSSIATTTSDLSSSVGSLSSSVASINNTQNGRLDSLETASGSIRTDFNTFTSSYTTVSGSIDSRLDTLENTTSSTNLNYIDFDTTPSVSSIEGRLLWNNVDGTLDLGLKGGNVTLQVGQETLYEVRNETGIQIPNGTAVYANGVTVGSGRITVAPFTSNGTIRDINFLGLATENISNGVNGYVTHFGYTRGLDTRGTAASSIAVGDENWSVGDILYAHPTAAGKLTNVKPKHEISVAIIINRHQSSGVVFVRPTSFGHLFDNHDVDINTGSITTGDLLIYDSGNSVWKNGKSLQGDYVVTGSLTITQNLTVLGSSSLVYVTSSQLAVSASTISVNVFEPAERFGGLKIYDSGSSNATASLLWDSLNNHFIYQNVSGSDYSGGMLLAGPRNTGSLGDELGLINGRIAKSVGGDHLDNSIISETGTTITIAGNLVANSISGAFDYFGLVNRPTLVSGSSQINITGTTDYSTFSSSISTSIGNLSSSVATTTNNLSSSFSSSIGSLSSSIASIDNTQNSRLDSIESITGSISSLNSFTSSINTTIKSKLDSEGVVSGSSQIIYSGLTGIPSGIVSGSSQLTSSYDTRYVLSGSITQTTWDNIANKPSGLVSGSEQLTGSYDTRYVLSGSITQTTWDNIANKPNDIVSSSSQISAFGFLQTSSFNTFTSSYNTGSFTGSFTGSLFGTASYAMFALSSPSSPGFTTNMTQSSAAATWSFVHNLNTRNPIVQVYDSSYKQIIPNEIVGVDDTTAEIRFDYSQAGYAVASNGGGLYITGSTSRINQTSNATTWSFTHNLGTKYPSFEVFDSGDNVIIPAGIKATSVNTAEIYFATPTSGIAIANFSGINGSLENSLTSSFSLATNWDTIQDNPITGSLTSATAGTTTTVVSVSTGSYYGAFFDYVVISGSNSRAGTLMSTWNGSSVVFNESTTIDIGNTNQVTMSVDLSGTDVRLRSTNVNQWLVKSLIRLI